MAPTLQNYSLAALSIATSITWIRQQIQNKNPQQPD